MKRLKMFAAPALLALFLLLGCLGAAAEEALSLEMHPGETMAAPKEGSWKSSDASVATVDGAGNILAAGEGSCSLLFSSGQEQAAYTLVVDDGVPTELAKKAIAVAMNEFAALDGKRLKRNNKYSEWYAGKGASFGWCGAFAGWSLDQAGVPMCRVGKAAPVNAQDTFAIGEADVGKILKGYTKMGRTTNIPRPGYLVIYSVTGKAYYNIHVGMVVNVQDLGNGKYLITTVEGNVSNTVKSYQYYYDSSEEATAAQRNMEALPKEMQTDEKTCYKLHDKSWFIKIFCQTYE